MEITGNTAVFTPTYQRQDSTQNQNSTKVSSENFATNSKIQNENNPKETEDAKNSDPLKENDAKKDEQELDKLTQDLNKELNSLNVDAKFGFDDKTGAMFVSLYEKDSDKLLRKIPSDEVMRMMSKMKELMGSIIDKQA
jgi:flagellar protein FlaG